MGAFRMVFIVAPNAPIGGVQDLIPRAKVQSGRFNLGSIMIDRPHKLSAELWKIRADLDAAVMKLFMTRGQELGS